MAALRRLPISGWQRSVYAAARFDTGGELQAARLLDASGKVEWWLRNDPAIFRIPTPVTNFEPDFIYRIKGNPAGMGILEIKGELFWDGEGSEARIKAETACEWVKAVRKAGWSEQWQFAIVLEQDALQASSLESMVSNAQRREP
jgi:Endonuclease domain